MNKQLIIIGAIAVFATVGIVQVTTPTYFTPLGEQRHHYFVGVYPIQMSEEQQVDYGMLCHYYFGEWIETEEKQGCDFRTTDNMNDFQKRLVTGETVKDKGES